MVVTVFSFLTEIGKAWGDIFSNVPDMFDTLGGMEIFAPFKNFRPVKDTLDILILALLLYLVFRFIEGRRALKLAWGLVLFFLFLGLSSIIGFNASNFVFSKFYQMGILLIVFIFQPEIRSALEKMGGSTIELKNNITSVSKRKTPAHSFLINLCSAVGDLSKDKTGALIVLENTTRLGDLIETGEKVDWEPTVDMIKSVFYKGAPFHDGAIVIRNMRIVAARCFAPNVAVENINEDIGSRHRAAVAISKECDAVVIVVSEESGIISIAYDGFLSRNYNIDSLLIKIENIFAKTAIQKVTKSREEIDKDNDLVQIKKKNKKSKANTNGNNTVKKQKKKNEDNTEDIPQEEEEKLYIKAQNKKLKIQSIITNVFILFICLVTSTGIWLYVMNTESPEYRQTFDNIEVTIEGSDALLEDYKLMIANDYIDKVDITLKGPKTVMQQYDKASIKATVALGEINAAGEYVLSVEVNPPSGLTLGAIEPAEITVTLDTISDKTVELRANPLYSISKLYDVNFTPDMTEITLSGPDSIVKKVEYAAVKYDLGTINTSMTFRSTILLFDANNREIDRQNISMNKTETIVKVDVATTADIPLEVIYTTTEKDYTYDIKTSPKTISVTGDPAYVGKLESLQFDIGDITSKYLLTVSSDNIDIPEGVSLVNQTGFDISITITRTPVAVTTTAD